MCVRALKLIEDDSGYNGDSGDDDDALVQLKKNARRSKTTQNQPSTRHKHKHTIVNCFFRVCCSFLMHRRKVQQLNIQLYILFDNVLLLLLLRTTVQSNYINTCVCFCNIIKLLLLFIIIMLNSVLFTYCAYIKYVFLLY